MISRRELISEKLKMDMTRRGTAHGNSYMCEGQSFKPHECRTAIDMNEVLFTRGDIQHLSEKQKEYYWSEINCSLNCRWFHAKWGESRKFRDWFVRRMINLFSRDIVAYYIKNSVVKNNDYAWVLTPFVKKKKLSLTRESGKVEAVIFGDTMMKVCKSIQMILDPAGWAFDENIIERIAPDQGVINIEIEAEDTKQIYRTTLALFQEKGKKYNRGTRAMIVLPLKYWNKSQTGQTVLWEQLDNQE